MAAHWWEGNNGVMEHHKDIHVLTIRTK